MTAETATSTLAYISAGCTFAVLLVILVGTAVRQIRRSNRSNRSNRRNRSMAMPPCSHQRLALDACDDAICVDCGENLT